MGCSISCSTFEKISTFLHWLTTKESNSENLDHYLDDFFFAGKANSNDWQSLVTKMQERHIRTEVFSMLLF
jgi:hypothetical protein